MSHDPYVTVQFGRDGFLVGDIYSSEDNSTTRAIAFGILEILQRSTPGWWKYFKAQQVSYFLGTLTFLSVGSLIGLAISRAHVEKTLFFSLVAAASLAYLYKLFLIVSPRFQIINRKKGEAVERLREHHRNFYIAISAAIFGTVVGSVSTFFILRLFGYQ